MAIMNRINFSILTEGTLSKEYAFCLVLLNNIYVVQLGSIFVDMGGVTGSGLSGVFRQSAPFVVSLQALL